MNFPLNDFRLRARFYSMNAKGRANTPSRIDGAAGGANKEGAAKPGLDPGVRRDDGFRVSPRPEGDGQTVGISPRTQ